MHLALGLLLQATTAASQPALRERAHALSSTLTITFLILLVFLVGSFVMIRLGRAALARSHGRSRTDYVDAWGQARVTDEQIRAATQEDDDAPEEPER